MNNVCILVYLMHLSKAIIVFLLRIAVNRYLISDISNKLSLLPIFALMTGCGQAKECRQTSRDAKYMTSIDAHAQDT